MLKQIFEHEINAGLAELMTDCSIASYLDIFEAEADKIDFGLDAIKEYIASAQEREVDDATLFYMQSILVTLGWNLNDDIFLRDEVYNARHTPVNKPFNRMHNQDDIIGHMTNATLLNSSLQPSEDFEHVAVSSVIYKAWRDVDKRSEIAELIEEIRDGKWKVSMECVFSGFDYGLIDKNGNQRIVQRTPETSHMTKHLRKYKGDGYYNGERIGRAFRDINFCGKGLVKKPGNPFSSVLNANKKFFGAIASIDNNKESRMNELEMALANLKSVEDKLKLAETEIAKLKSEANEITQAKFDETIKAKDAEITEKDGAIASLREDLTKTSTNLADANAKITVLETAKTEIATQYEAIASEHTKLKGEVVLAHRKAALTSAKVSEERQDAILAKFASASDEMFNELVANIKPTESVTTTVETTVDFSKAEVVEPPLSVTTEPAKKDNSSIVSFMQKTFSNHKQLQGVK